MTRLNLGCGSDIRPGYVNVDYVRTPGVDEVHDLTTFPWPWKSDSIDEILMLDFLEHIPYKKTEDTLLETWRVLCPSGHVNIQVPDFVHCARAAMQEDHYLCNVCGVPSENFNDGRCTGCGTSVYDVGRAAIQRLYGGQDREGNWHFNAFTPSMLQVMLANVGFGMFEMLETEHQWANWNFKLRAYKTVEW